jgi:hypothetical protein
VLIEEEEEEAAAWFHLNGISLFNKVCMGAVLI